MDERHATRGLSLAGTRGLALAAMMAGLTAVLAYVRIPLPISPVPVSAQTLGTMLAGSVLGARLGAASQLVYVLMGALGLPVYAGGAGGLSVLLGPTGGYLVGFVLGAYVTGWMASSSRAGAARLLMAHLVGGVLVPYAVGVLQLALVTGMNLPQAVAAGALPFLAGDAVKVVVATAVARRLRSALGPDPAAARNGSAAAGG